MPYGEVTRTQGDGIYTVCGTVGMCGRVLCPGGQADTLVGKRRERRELVKSLELL